MRIKTEVFAYIPKSVNSYWAGKGRVISLDVNLGSVFVTMLTGKAKGDTGGFYLDCIRFKTVRTEVPGAEAD